MNQRNKWGEVFKTSIIGGQDLSKLMPVDMNRALYLKILIRSDSINAGLFLVKAFLVCKVPPVQIDVNDQSLLRRSSRVRRETNV